MTLVLSPHYTWGAIAIISLGKIFATWSFMSLLMGQHAFQLRSMSCPSISTMYFETSFYSKVNGIPQDMQNCWFNLGWKGALQWQHHRLFIICGNMQCGWNLHQKMPNKQHPSNSNEDWHMVHNDPFNTQPCTIGHKCCPYLGAKSVLCQLQIRQPQQMYWIFVQMGRILNKHVLYGYPCHEHQWI